MYEKLSYIVHKYFRLIVLFIFYTDRPRNFSRKERALLETYVDLLRPFKEVTVIMSGDQYPTLSLYAPMVLSLHKSVLSQETETTKNTQKKC